jgi:hypothetical protein
MYSNIPKEDVKSSIGSIINHIGFPKTQINEMQLLIDSIVKQNSFEHNSVYYTQSDGVAMGAPPPHCYQKHSSNTLSVITYYIY